MNPEVVYLLNHVILINNVEQQFQAYTIRTKYVCRLAKILY